MNLMSSSLVMWPIIARWASAARTGAFWPSSCGALPSHALRHRRRERVAAAREYLRYLGELRLEDQSPLVAGVVAVRGVADLEDEAVT